MYYDYDTGANLTNVLIRLFDKMNCPNSDININRDYTEIQQLYISSIKENSIFNISPELCEEWDYEKNKKIRPDMISYSSAKKVWWICRKCNKEYFSSVYSRYNGTGCPYCNNKILVKGLNDLATTNPNLAKEWNYEKNKGLNPSDVFENARRKVWWICRKCNYEWEAALYSRSRGTKCPACANKKVIKGLNDLATTNPELLKEWDFKKNVILPSEVVIGSRKKIWWLCDKKHSYMKSLVERKNGGGCPYCCNQKVLIGYNDLATTNPGLLKEWDFQKNNILPQEVTAGSHKKVWWKCSNNHSYQRVIYAKINQNKICPSCKKR